MSTQKEIQAQYDGFRSTPLLWITNEVFQLNQYDIDSSSEVTFDRAVESKVRLGMRVEQFLLHQLQQTDQTVNIHENIQIQRDKITLGELDFVFNNRNRSIHLEAVFKFYLYDASVGTTEIDHWIGPNRKDSLNQKLEKLTTKQLPRLFLKETKTILKEKGFNTDVIEQYVHFQAQLFVPFGSEKQSYKSINNACIRGFYINLNQLDLLKNSQFYIPSKVNWLANPTFNEPFMEMNEFVTAVSFYLDKKRSPLCWMKDENNLLTKFFVVWW